MLFATPVAHDMPWALAYSQLTAITAFKKYKSYQLENNMDGETEDSRLCKNQTNEKTEKLSQWVKKS